MALATRCPHCKTTFRVAADQLKLRGGIVRCGTCSQVFDGNASLVELDSLVKPRHPTVVPVEEQGDLTGHTIMAQELTEVETEAPPPPPKPTYVLDYDLSEPDPVDYDLSEPEGWTEDAEPAAEPAAESATIIAPDPAFMAEVEAGFEPKPDTISYLEPYPYAQPEPVHATVHAPEPEPAPEAEPEPEPEPEPEVEHDPEPSLELELDAAVLAATEAPAMPHEEPEDWPSPHELEQPVHDLEFGPLPLVRESAPAPEPEYVAPPRVEPVRHEAPPPPPDHDEPDFVRLHRAKEESARRRQLTFAAGSVLLILVLLAQLITNFRDTLAAQYPALKPALVSSCKLLGCKVELPAQIENLSIETGELQTLTPNSLLLTTLLSNEGSLVQAWPHIELELTDAADKPVVRRVFTPAQYLPQGALAAKGFAGKSEQPVKIQFELKQVKASGFHIAVFYP